MSKPTYDDLLDCGLRGLYDGLDAQAIRAHKGLNEHQDIFDHMNSDELWANSQLLRLADVMIKAHPEVYGFEAVSQLMREAGAQVRQILRERGAVMPEDQPTPDKSIEELRLLLDPATRIQLN